ncbi:MAG: RNA polymerase sigma factor RpoE [Halorhodospira sp.]
MSSEVSDRELVQRVQAGDKHAFDVLVLRYQQKLVKLIGRYVRDPQEALDVAQEAFIKAYRALPGFRGESSFYTWLYRIGVNTAKNHLVAQGRRPPDSDVDAQDAERYDIDTMLREQDTPEAEAYRDEVERTVINAIADLPEELRTAVTLRELEGMSYQEIAQVMECPVGTVRSRIFRAREAIDKRLQPLMGDEQS